MDANGWNRGPCGDCDFWVRNPATGGSPNPKTGGCRRNPPTVTVLFGSNKFSGRPEPIGQVAAFPELEENNAGCGEFKPRVQLTVA